MQALQPLWNQLVELPILVWGLASILMLPVLIASLLRPKAGISFDPWRVNKLKYTLFWSAPFYTLLHLAYHVHRQGVLGDAAMSGGWFSQIGPAFFFVWQPWLFVGLMFHKLRYGQKDPLQGAPKRVASLTPRGSNSVVRRGHWQLVWLLWLACGLSLHFFGTGHYASAAWLSWGSGCFFLALGPTLVRRSLEGEAEPFNAEHDDLNELDVSYREHRRATAWMIFRLVVGGATFNTLVALIRAFGFEGTGVPFLPTFLTIGWLIVEISIYTLRRFKIARLQRGAVV